MREDQSLVAGGESQPAALSQVIEIDLDFGRYDVLVNDTSKKNREGGSEHLCIGHGKFKADRSAAASTLHDSSFSASFVFGVVKRAKGDGRSARPVVQQAWKFAYRRE